ncbi:MAG: zinc ABC transporter substrate-binding protein, partial [Solirubrobacterales bacterium]|nr:zinc ABC transporter substrate-binding protein [Solirubrobacterales bacterium]
VRAVGGSRVSVDQILAANADPHEYEPRPSDAEALLDADLVVKSGGDLDGWLDQLVEGSGSDAPVLTLIDFVQTRPGPDGSDDPHWWHDPENAVAAVATIRDRLVEFDPDDAAAYRSNAAAYIAKLKALERRIGACIGAIPAAKRKLVTSHDALGYYADRFGIEVVGAAIPALSTQAQPSAGETADLIDLIERTNVSTVFPEAGVSTELEATIADEAGATVGGNLWADTLGPEGSNGATYIEAEESNTATLVAGLSGAQTCEVRIAEPHGARERG